ncbi:MAG: septation protein A [Pseudomonadota bacterium]
MGKFFLDFFPVVLFFVVFKAYDDPTEGIIAATGVAIVASVIQVGYTRLRHGKVENMHLIMLAMIVVLGGLTIALRDETFIKWKPTIVNWAFAAAFLGSQFIGSKTLIQRAMEKALSVPGPIWTRLNLGWVGFFVFSGVANLYVAYNFETDTWVNFKLFGLLGLTLVWVLLQSLYLMKHIQDDAPDGEETATEESGGE